MTLAQQRLAELAAWIGLSSRSRRTRMGTISFGPWAVIVASDVTEPPMSGFNPKALPLFVPKEQTEGVKLAAIDKAAPDSQDDMASRLGHLIWRVRDGKLPPAAIIGLESPSQPLQDAIAGAGGDTLDITAIPFLCVPLWALTANEYAPIAGKLPLLS